MPVWQNESVACFNLGLPVRNWNPYRNKTESYRPGPSTNCLAFVCKFTTYFDLLNTLRLAEFVQRAKCALDSISQRHDGENTGKLMRRFDEGEMKAHRIFWQRVRRTTTLNMTIVFCGAAFICNAARAQNQRASAADASELGQDNMRLVSASPAEIKTVLGTDPGLMVELKRWVAKDATNHGQIIGEADLTDDAIYSRLESDVQFRAIATQLVQRYGYLSPKVNPQSVAGKEQELLIAERVKWIAQDEEETRTQERARRSKICNRRAHA